MISVHAISMIYELRALRSRLQEMLTQLLDAPTQRDVEYMLSMVNLQISKVERTGDYIAALEREVQAAGPPEEVDLGSLVQHRYDDHGRCVRCGDHRPNEV